LSTSYSAYYVKLRDAIACNETCMAVLQVLMRYLNTNPTYSEVGCGYLLKVIAHHMVNLATGVL